VQKHGDGFISRFGKQFSTDQRLDEIRRIPVTNSLNLNYVAPVRRDDTYYYTISSSPEKEIKDGSYDRF
jgi:hypothetical protein